MVAALEIVFSSFKKSLDLKLWLCFLLVGFLNIIAFFLCLAVLLIPASAVFYLFGASTLSLALWLFFGLLGLVLLLYIGAVFWGALLFLAKEFVDKGKVSLESAFNNSLQRAPALFFATGIIIVFFGILLSLLILPAMLPVINSLQETIQSGQLFNQKAQSTGPGVLSDSFLAQIMSSSIVLFLMIGFLLVIGLLVSPFTALVAPIVLFENTSAFNGIKKAVIAAKENYFKNLASILVYFIVSTMITVFFFFVVAGLNLLGLIFAAGSANIALRMALEIIGYLLEAFAGIIVLSFVSVFSINYYYYNFFHGTTGSKQAGKEKPESRKESEIEPEEKTEKEEKKEIKEDYIEEKEEDESYHEPEENEVTGKQESIKLEPWMEKKT